MKFIRIYLIATIFIGASVCVPNLGYLNNRLFKSNVLLKPKPCFPNLLKTKQNLNFGTRFSHLPGLCKCDKNVQQSALEQFQQQHCQLQQQQSSMCEDYGCSCNRQPLLKCECGDPPLEEKVINLKLRFMVPKGCSINTY